MSEILPFEGANYKRVIEHFTGMLNTPAKLDNVLHRIPLEKLYFPEEKA